MTPIFSPKKKKNPTDRELIEELRKEIVRVREQRNEYVQQLILLGRQVNYLKSDNEYYESYINRTNQKKQFKNWKS